MDHPCLTGSEDHTPSHHSIYQYIIITIERHTLRSSYEFAVVAVPCNKTEEGYKWLIKIMDIIHRVILITDIINYKLK